MSKMEASVYSLYTAIGSILHSASLTIVWHVLCLNYLKKTKSTSTFREKALLNLLSKGRRARKCFNQIFMLVQTPTEASLLKLILYIVAILTFRQTA